MNILSWLRFKPITYDYDLLVFYINSLQEYYIVRELNFFLIKTIFLWENIQRILSKLIENLLNKVNRIDFISVDQDIIQKNSNINILFLI